MGCEDSPTLKRAQEYAKKMAARSRPDDRTKKQRRASAALDQQNQTHKTGECLCCADHICQPGTKRVERRGGVTTPFTRKVHKRIMENRRRKSRD